MDGGRILYATDVLPAGDPSRRVPRREQSVAASRLLARLTAGFVPSAHSKSHSRALVAAAVGDVAGLSLGIDIEWMAPGRPFAAIARDVLDVAGDIDAEAFYRGWTFYEAYYKAFQRFPDGDDTRTVVASARDGEIVRLDGETCAIQHRVAGAFRLCVVWRDAGDWHAHASTTPHIHALQRARV